MTRPRDDRAAARTGRGGLGRRGLLAGAAALLGGARKPSMPAPAAVPPALFCYPAPYRRPDGSIMANPVAMEVGSFTDRFPTIAELSGVVVMPFWSSLNPDEGVFDFSLVAAALEYWQRSGRTVVLGAVTAGYPVRAVSGALIGAVPDWVVRRSATCRQAIRVIGSVVPMGSAATAPVEFPLYWDPAFQAAEAALVAALARFDGHPALGRVRVCTGIMGEDNPTFDGLRDAMPGFSPLAWIAYSRRVLALYRRAFTRTGLEFDVDRMGFIRALGSETERRAADGFMRELDRDGVFLAMNGLDVPDVDLWRAGTRSGPACSLDYVAARRRSGTAVGLEGGGVSHLDDADVLALARAFRRIDADRFVAFPDSIAAINWCRDGRNAQNETSVRIYGPDRMTSMGALSQRFLDALGCVGPAGPVRHRA